MFSHNPYQPISIFKKFKPKPKPYYYLKDYSKELHIGVMSLPLKLHYVHLNPVRAKLCTVDELKGHALSSYPKYFKRKVPPPLERTTLLGLCDLPDTLGGMRKYTELLKLSQGG